MIWETAAPLLRTKSLTHTLGSEEPIAPLQTGLPSLDGHLEGGLYPGGLAEVYGAPGTGKTALVCALAASAAQAGAEALLLDCDGSIIPARPAQILSARNAPPQSLTRVSIARVTSWEALTASVVHLLAREVDQREGKVRLIAIDSLAFLFRTAGESVPQKRLEAFAMRLAAIAAEFALCVVVVNHARALRDSMPVMAAMGEGWQYVCETRLSLSVDGRGNRFVEVVKSPLANRKMFRFQVYTTGLGQPAEDEEMRMSGE